jgi:hypothetical protein
MSKKVNKNVPELRFKEFKEKLSNYNAPHKSDRRLR